MNYKLLFSLLLFATVINYSSAQSLPKSEFIEWTKIAVMPHLKNGVRALGSDLKVLKNTAQVIIPQLASKGFTALRSVIKNNYDKTLVIGIIATMLTSVLVEASIKISSAPRVGELDDLYRLLKHYENRVLDVLPESTSVNCTEAIDSIKNHKLQHSSQQIKDTFELLQKLVGSESTANYYAFKQLLKKLETEIKDELKNICHPTLPVIIASAGIIGSFTMSQLA